MCRGCSPAAIVLHSPCWATRQCPMVTTLSHSTAVSAHSSAPVLVLSQHGGPWLPWLVFPERRRPDLFDNSCARQSFQRLSPNLLSNPQQLLSGAEPMSFLHPHCCPNVRFTSLSNHKQPLPLKEGPKLLKSRAPSSHLCPHRLLGFSTVTYRVSKNILLYHLSLRLVPLDT